MQRKSWKEQYREQKESKCKHYNGTSKETCSAGVNYHELVGNAPGWGCKLPCTGDEGCSHAPEIKVVPCALREFRTLDEIDAEAARALEHFQNSIKARRAITDFLKENNKPQRSVSGQIPCPVCNGGALHFSIASNGHCHARCSTSGCTNWME